MNFHLGNNIERRRGIGVIILNISFLDCSNNNPNGIDQSYQNPVFKENGDLSYITNYKDGKVDGIWKSYLDGKLSSSYLIPKGKHINFNEGEK